MNCWEHKKCGREEGGSNCEEFGICPAYTETRTNGIHNGINGGRCCWVIAGTICGGVVQGTFAQKVLTCMRCDFYGVVLKEEGEDNFIKPTKIYELIKEPATYCTNDK